MAIDSTRLHRHVPLGALRNVREVGGYTGRAGQTVRWHRLYRGDDPSRATAEDLDALAGLGLRTIIDLRSGREVRARPPLALPGAPVDRHHIPLLRDGWRPRVGPSGEGRSGDGPGVDGRGVQGPDMDQVLLERYVAMLVEGAPGVADVLAILASPAAYPVLVHSALGKDRTGVLVAVVLGLLAVRDESIVDDYAESEVRLGVDAAAPTAAPRDDPASAAGVASVSAAGAPPEVMARLLARIRSRARSMVGFARTIGVPFETVEALHTNLLS